MVTQTNEDSEIGIHMSPLVLVFATLTIASCGLILILFSEYFKEENDKINAAIRKQNRET